MDINRSKISLSQVISRLSLFWRFQIGGWIVFVVLSFPLKLIIFGSLSVSLVWIVWDMIAFGYTFILLFIYRKIYQQHTFVRIATIAGIMSLLGGVAETFISWTLHHYSRTIDISSFSLIVAFGIFYIRTGLFAGWSMKSE